MAYFCLEPRILEPAPLHSFIMSAPVDPRLPTLLCLTTGGPPPLNTPTKKRMTARQKKKKILLKEKITKNMKTPTANTANTTPSGKDSAPPLKDTLLRLLLKEKKKKKKKVCTETKTMSKKTKTKTNMNKKTTVARIPVLGLLVVVLVVNIIPVIVLSDPLVRQVPSLAHTDPQKHIC